MRLVPASADSSQLKAILDPRRLLRWVFIGRLCLASAIFIAAVSSWSDANPTNTLVASLAFAISTVVTVVSAGYAEIYRKRAAEKKQRTTRGDGVVSTMAKRFPIRVTTTYTEPGDEAADGANRAATAIFQDISDQKRLEALGRRAERLEGIAELSASLAHEIKNPLASIRSSVEQISRMPAVTDDQKVLTALVMRESDRLSRLLSEFLDFARVRVARSNRVDLASVARGAANLAAAHPDRDESVSVKCIVLDDEAIAVDGDEDLLHRAVFNLALNAVQASPSNGEVCIEVARGNLGAIPDGMSFDTDAVSLRVTDGGPGIPTEIRDKMFDPFFTTKANGSGLGLAVVHRAIEAHRGHVFVDSTTRGTRFTVILPRSRQSVRSAT